MDEDYADEDDDDDDGNADDDSDDDDEGRRGLQQKCCGESDCTAGQIAPCSKGAPNIVATDRDDEDIYHTMDHMWF